MGIKVPKGGLKKAKASPASRKISGNVRFGKTNGAGLNKTTGRIPGTKVADNISKRRTVLLKTSDLSGATRETPRTRASAPPPKKSSAIPWIITGSIAFIVLLIGIISAASNNDRSSQNRSTYSPHRTTSRNSTYRRSPRGQTNSINGMSWQDWCKTTEGQNELLLQRRQRMKKAPPQNR